MKKIFIIPLLFVCHFSTLAATVDPSILKQLDTHYSHLLDQHSPGATILVAKNGEILFHKAYGMADAENHVPMSTSHHFRIASLTKQFTTVAVQLLAEQGKVKMSDNINKHLPGYPTHGEVITLAHLASNTSGIPNCQALPGWKQFEKENHTLEEILAFFSDEPLNFKPGSQYEYSSSNFMLLAKLIEVKSGLTYGQFLRQYIFEPLGMKDTFMGSESKILPNRARGYSFKSGLLVNADALSMTVPHGAGALRSTTSDLFKWQSALVAGKVLSEQSLNQAWKITTLNDGSQSDFGPYGYGWFVGPMDGKLTVSHSGGIPGFTSFSAILPEEKIQVVVLHNIDNNQNFIPEVQAAIAIKAVTRGQLLPKLVNKLPARYEQLLGNYKADYYGGLSGAIIERDDQLFFERHWEGKEHPIDLAEDGNLYGNNGWTQIIPVIQNGEIAGVKMQRWNGRSWYFKKI